MAADPAPPPLPVILKHREVMAAAIASSSRAKGGGIWFTLFLFAALYVALWLGGFLTFWGVQQLPFAVMFAIGPWLPDIVTAVLCLVAVKLALDFEQRRAGRAYLKRLAAIGSPLERPGTYEVTPEALVLTTERMVLAPRWHAIDTLERGADGWVLSADQLHFLIPFAAFPEEDAQRPLLAAITARMTPEARARSREAVEFAEGAAAELAPASQAAAAAPEGPTSSSEELSASGWLTQEQASWGASVIYADVARPGFHRWAYPLTGAVTGTVVAIVAVGLLILMLPRNLLWQFPTLAFGGILMAILAGSALGLATAYKRLGLVLDKAWRSGLESRGVPLQIEARWSLTDSGLSYATARFSGEAPFSAIQQILYRHGYWIVAIDALTLCIPDTAFVSGEQARVFMSHLLARIDEPARARSVNLSADSISRS